MKYFIPLFDGVFIGKECFDFYAGGKYLLKDNDLHEQLYFNCNRSISSFSNLTEVKCGLDSYLFCNNITPNSPIIYKIKINNQDVILSVSNKLVVTLNEVLICEENVDNLRFSHTEIIGESVLFYFEGKRNYLLVIKNQQVIFSHYYDECNLNHDEKYFMGKVFDSLNHGKVCHIKGKVVETYLVYCDNHDMELKNEFLGHIFLDCVKVSNLIYLENMVEDLPVKEICDFLPQFDYFYAVDEKKFILLNKNALAGILEFEFKTNKITNIKILD